MSSPAQTPTLEDLTRLLSDESPMYVKYNNQKLYINNIVSMPTVAQVYEPKTGLLTRDYRSQDDVLKEIVSNKTKDPTSEIEVSLSLLHFPEGTSIDPYDHLDEDLYQPIKFPVDKHKEIMKYKTDYDTISKFSQKANTHVLLTTDSRGDGRINGGLLSPELQSIRTHLCRAINEIDKYYQYHEGFKIDLEFPSELSFMSRLNWYVDIHNYDETTGNYCPYLRIMTKF
ncbi:MAG: hypothetical protein PHG66_01005 [Candidatus Colwellbacteria bacterium]|nr:hypothetical protein [Candidatus Colwellbacteria bacterium]